MASSFASFEPLDAERFRRDLVLPIRVSCDTGELDASTVVDEMRCRSLAGVEFPEDRA